MILDELGIVTDADEGDSSRAQQPVKSCLIGEIKGCGCFIEECVPRPINEQPCKRKPLLLPGDRMLAQSSSTSKPPWRSGNVARFTSARALIKSSSPTRPARG